MGRMPTILALLAALSFACDPSAWARHARGAASQGTSYSPSYYISTSGSDSNAGTLGSPWAITALNTKQSTYAGMTVCVLAGTYDISSLMGTFHSPALTLNGGPNSSNPTNIISCNGSGVYTPRVAILDVKGASGFYGGGNGNLSTMMGVSDQDTGGGPTPTNWSNLTVDGLILENWSLWAFQVGSFNGNGGPASNVHLLNLEFTNGNGANSTGLSGVHSAGLELYYYSGTTASRNGVVVSNCFFNNNTANSVNTNDTHYAAIQVWGGISVDNSTSSSGLIVEKSTFFDTGPIYGGDDTGIIFDTLLQQNFIDSTESNPAMQASPTRGFGNSLTSSITSLGTVIRNNIFKGGLGGFDGGPPASEGSFSTAVVFANNTIDLDGGTVGPGPGSRIALSAGFSGLIKNYDNLYWDNGDTGIGAAGAYGYANGNTDGFSVADYNIYGTQTGSNIFTTYSSSGGATEVVYSTFAAWKSAIGGLEAHSSQSSSNPFTSGGSRALAYLVQSGSPAYQTGKTGGTSGGSTVNVGAWDGIVTQIGSVINGVPD